MTKLPAEQPPSSFPFALAGAALLSTGVPMCLGMSVASWSRWGLNAFIMGLYTAILSCLVTSLVMGLGVRNRRRWWRRSVRGIAVAFPAGWLITLTLSLAHLLGLLAPSASANPRLGPISWTGLVILLALALPTYWLLRTSRDPYWQAGAT